MKLVSYIGTYVDKLLKHFLFNLIRFSLFSFRIIVIYNNQCSRRFSKILFLPVLNQWGAEINEYVVIIVIIYNFNNWFNLYFKLSFNRQTRSSIF